jgi:hypothetical protein
MSAIWIAADGTYGSGHVVSIDTTDWHQSDFEELAEAPDCTRLELAFVIAASHLGGRLR